MGNTVDFGGSFTLGTAFTHNDVHLLDTLTGVHRPRAPHNVHWAIGVGGAFEFDVNFGRNMFRWKEGSNGA